MTDELKQTLWHQFGASLDMLENAIRMCPDKLWDTKARFWGIAYHTLYFTDYYLCLEPDTFKPIPPFKSDPNDNSEFMPEPAYSKEELLQYLLGCRDKCHSLISTLTEEVANQRWINDRKNYPFIEIMIYNMRHVQHHAAQLNLLLRQGIDDAPKWVSRAKEKL